MNLAVLAAADAAPWEAGHPMVEPAPPTERSDAELVAALLADGAPTRESRRRAAAILDLCGGLEGLHHAPRSLLEEAGLPLAKVYQLRSALELGLRCASAPPAPEPLCADTLARLFRPLLVHLGHEEMHLVLLDGRGRFRGRRRLASGGMASCSLYARDVLAPVVEARAPAFALVHNHPSGVSSPSPEDVSLSTRVITAAEAVGARLVDHLVVAEDGHASAMPSGARWPSPRGRVRAL